MPAIVVPLRQNRILQQDRAPPHVSRLTNEFLEINDIRTLDSWPPMSPDLNPIENLWCTLKRNVVASNPRNLIELKTITFEEFNKLEYKYL